MSVVAAVVTTLVYCVVSFTIITAVAVVVEVLT